MARNRLGDGQYRRRRKKNVFGLTNFSGHEKKGHTFVAKKTLFMVFFSFLGSIES
jgi:hypothetical protein